MIDYKIFTYQNRNQWWEGLKSIEVEDIFFSPEYLKCNEIIYHNTSECFYYYNDNNLILYPYIKRQIFDTKYYDITSVYGYGGYIGKFTRESLVNFRKLFHQYCLDNNIVSEFIRFHPFYTNITISDDIINFIEYRQEIVYFDYEKENDLNSVIKAEARKKVRKAKKNGIAVIEDNTQEGFENFHRIYYKTMVCLGAESFYFFSPEFFVALHKLLPNSCKLFMAQLDNKPIGGLLILTGRDYSYNFLSGSLLEYRKLGVNDFLQYEVLFWALEMGKKKHLLGGGINEGDSLFQFKAKFSPYRTKYYIGKKIHNLEIYNRLSEIQFDSESAAVKGWFPAYRFKTLNELK